MTTIHHTFRSHVIQSVRVHTAPKPAIFVVTRDPELGKVVRELLEQTEKNVSVIWLTSVESACRRLEWSPVSLVVVDADIGEENALNRLRSEAAADTRVVVLTGATVSKPVR